MKNKIPLTSKLSTIALALAIALSGCGNELEPSADELTNDNQYTPPVITSTPSTDGLAGEEYSYTITATDAENDPLTFSATLPDDSWLMFDAATGILSGTPASDDAGNITVSLTVNDGTFNVTESFTIAVAGAAAPATTDNILSNSTFSAGSTNWSFNAGSYVYENLVPEATTNVYDTGISHSLTLVTGEVYTLTYEAKASAVRPMTAGFGLFHDPWTNDAEVVELTTEWQEYEFSAAASAGDDNSRTIFDMGGAVPGDIHLRNVKLVNSSDIDIFETTDPVGSFFEVDVATAGEISSANLTQTVSIEQGKSYVVSFKAKASVERSLEVGLGNGDLSALETVALTTEWLPLFAVIDAADFGGNDSQVIFNMGAEVGDVYLDDIEVGMVLAAGAPQIDSTAETIAIVGEVYSYTLTAVDPENDVLIFSATLPEGSWLSFDQDTGILSGTPTAIDLDSSVDVSLTVSDSTSTIAQAFTIDIRGLLVNNGFDQGVSDWNASSDNIVYEVAVASAGNPWEVNYSQVLSLVTDEVYTFSFDAKASVARNITAAIGLNEDPWTNVAPETAPALTTEWQSFSFDLTSPVTSDNSRTIFDMGAEVGDVTLRNIKLLDSEGTDLVLTATNIINAGNNYYQALIPAAGDAWAVNLSQVTVIEPAKDYVIKFKAKASIVRSIIVGVGLNGDPWNSSTEDVALTTEWQDYEIQVIATDINGVDFGDLAARVLFDMGAEAGDVSLDDITVEKVLDNP